MRLRSKAVETRSVFVRVAEEGSATPRAALILRQSTQKTLDKSDRKCYDIGITRCAIYKEVLVSVKTFPISLSVVKELDISLSRDSFLQTLLGHLLGTLQNVVGVEEASGFLSLVSQQVGLEINESYKKAWDLPELTQEQVGEVLVDMKRRIQGNFLIAEQDDEKIVFVNTVCPFGENVMGRHSLCMMTSNVFGSIAGENLGYAKVSIEESLAKGHPGCRVVVYFKPTPVSQAAAGREYFKA